MLNNSHIVQDKIKVLHNANHFSTHDSLGRFLINYSKIDDIIEIADGNPRPDVSLYYW